jgi:hypothetical protein
VLCGPRRWQLVHRSWRMGWEDWDTGSRSTSRGKNCSAFFSFLDANSKQVESVVPLNYFINSTDLTYLIARKYIGVLLICVACCFIRRSPGYKKQMRHLERKGSKNLRRHSACVRRAPASEERVWHIE